MNAKTLLAIGAAGVVGAYMYNTMNPHKIIKNETYKAEQQTKFPKDEVQNKVRIV